MSNNQRHWKIKEFGPTLDQTNKQDSIELHYNDNNITQ